MSDPVTGVPTGRPARDIAPERLVRFETRKWPDFPHWEFDAARLGVDPHGVWVGVPEGGWLSRPGRGFGSPCDHVVLVPHDAWWLATFYGRADPRRPVDVYVDIATPAEWSADRTRVRSVDLDLDVIRGTTGRTWVDDEDEFAAHQVELDYPSTVVDAAGASCERVLEAVGEARNPFDEATCAGWLALLRSLWDH